MEKWLVLDLCWHIWNYKWVCCWILEYAHTKFIVVYRARQSSIRSRLAWILYSNRICSNRNIGIIDLIEDPIVNETLYRCLSNIQYCNASDICTNVLRCSWMEIMGDIFNWNCRWTACPKCNTFIF